MPQLIMAVKAFTQACKDNKFIDSEYRNWPLKTCLLRCWGITSQNPFFYYLCSLESQIVNYQ